METAPEKHEIHVSPNFRWLENAHILLWLMKDVCWVSNFRLGGTVMIGPTLGMACYILWRTRKQRPEFFHNLAIIFWICANSIWMLGEFFKFEHEGRLAAQCFFFTGLSILLFYYLVFFRKDRKMEKDIELK